MKSLIVLLLLQQQAQATLFSYELTGSVESIPKDVGFHLLQASVGDPVKISFSVYSQEPRPDTPVGVANIKEFSREQKVLFEIGDSRGETEIVSHMFYGRELEKNSWHIRSFFGEVDGNTVISRRVKLSFLQHNFWKLETPSSFPPLSLEDNMRIYISESLCTLVDSGCDGIGSVRYDVNIEHIENYQYLPGDANGDLVFDQLDLIQALSSGKYNTGQRAGWAEGDWNGDEKFNQNDITEALTVRNYRSSRLSAVTPEPSSALLLAVGFILIVLKRNENSCNRPSH